MLRRTLSAFGSNPYLIFLADLSKSGKLRGIRAPGKFAGNKYRLLSPKEKSALQQRAKRLSPPAAQLAYRRLAKQELKNKNVPLEQRKAALTKKWAEAKQAQRKKAQEKPTSAKSKVKKAAKSAKKNKK